MKTYYVHLHVKRSINRTIPEDDNIERPSKLGKKIEKLTKENEQIKTFKQLK